MDFFTELLQYIINVLPSNTAGDVVAVVTFIVTLCTLVIRFWKEPDPKSGLHKLWSLIHLLASFRLPDRQAGKDGKNGDDTNGKQATPKTP